MEINYNPLLLELVLKRQVDGIQNNVSTCPLVTGLTDLWKVLGFFLSAMSLNAAAKAPVLSGLKTQVQVEKS